MSLICVPGLYSYLHIYTVTSMICLWVCLLQNRGLVWTLPGFPGLSWCWASGSLHCLLSKYFLRMSLALWEVMVPTSRNQSDGETGPLSSPACFSSSSSAARVIFKNCFKRQTRFLLSPTAPHSELLPPVAAFWLLRGAIQHLTSGPC